MQSFPTISERFGVPPARISRRVSTRTWDVNVVDPTSDPDWDALVASHPDASFFHRAAWAKVLSKTYGHKPISLLLSKDAEPVALVPLLEVDSPFTGRRGVCLPFTDLCDPLFFREMRFRHRLETSWRTGSEPEVETFRNSRRRHLRTGSPAVTQILRAYLGSAEWSGGPFRRIFRFSPTRDPQSRTLQP